MLLSYFILGKETALDLAGRGAKVILACRNLELASSVAEDLRKATSNDQVIAQHLDLTSFASIRKFSQDFIQGNDRLDILVNNAGLYGPKERRLTEDGIELQFQT